LGRIQRLQGQLDEAEFTLRGCLKAIPEGGRAEQALALRELGQCRQQRGDLHDAADHFRRAIEQLEEVQDIAELGLTYRLFGDAMRDLDQMDAARDAYRTAAMTLETAA
jgi:tetratricopeptide (TPR) repeat protein